MVGGLWWSFGEPRLENGEIVTDFYFQIGRHIELRFPWPVRRFDGAGGLSLQLDNGAAAGPRLAPDLISNRQETGRKLYEILGKEAQSSLIRAFKFSFFMRYEYFGMFFANVSDNITPTAKRNFINPFFKLTVRINDTFIL